MSSFKATTWVTKHQNVDGLKVTLIRKRPVPDNVLTTQQESNLVIKKSIPEQVVIPSGPRWIIEDNKDPCRLVIKRRARAPTFENDDKVCSSGKTGLKMRIISSSKARTRPDHETFARTKSWCKEQISNSASVNCCASCLSSSLELLGPQRSPKDGGLDICPSSELFRLQPSPKDSGIDVSSPSRKYDESHLSDSTCVAVATAECAKPRNDAYGARQGNGIGDSWTDRDTPKHSVAIKRSRPAVLNLSYDEKAVFRSAICSELTPIIGENNDKLGTGRQITTKTVSKDKNSATFTKKTSKKKLHEESLDVVPEQQVKRNCSAAQGRKPHSGSRNSVSQRSFARLRQMAESINPTTCLDHVALQGADKKLNCAGEMGSGNSGKQETLMTCDKILSVESVVVDDSKVKNNEVTVVRNSTKKPNELGLSTNFLSEKRIGAAKGPADLQVQSAEWSLLFADRTFKTRSKVEEREYEAETFNSTKKLHSEVPSCKLSLRGRNLKDESDAESKEEITRTSIDLPSSILEGKRIGISSKKKKVPTATLR